MESPQTNWLVLHPFPAPGTTAPGNIRAQWSHVHNSGLKTYIAFSFSCCSQDLPEMVTPNHLPCYP